MNILGAKVIFGNDEEGALGFPIIRNIPGTEEGELKKLHKGESFRLPNSFQKSLAWFLCASAVQRIRGYKKPLSMLIHTAAVQNYHFAVYERVQYWLNHDENIMALCRQVYEEEIYSVTLDDLLLANPEYGFANQVATSYPSFDEIEGEIRELLNDVRNIELGDDKSLEYGNGVHLCVDNCRANKEAEEGTYLRIVYPNDEQLDKLTKAPVFIVIGGNTLSRGFQRHR